MTFSVLSKKDSFPVSPIIKFSVSGRFPPKISYSKRAFHVIAAHLSKENNTPAHARAALAEALNCAADWIGIADQAAGFDWREI